MLLRACRHLLAVLAGFLAFTALGGGLALMSGLGAPPLAMLAGTPFGSYRVPGFCLFLLVGGTALAATIALVRRHRRAPLLAAAAGSAILVFEWVEVLAIGSPPGVARTLQVLYVALGIALLAGQILVLHLQEAS